MELAGYKLFYIVAIWVTGILAGLWPVLTRTEARYDRFFSLGNALGGGVFLGAGLIHLLPSSIDSFESLFGPEQDYPLASLVCAAGFLLVLLIEKVILGEEVEHLAAEADIRRYWLAPYILAFVLSVHALIAGIALGAESSLATSAALFVAIIAHKGVAAFALGVSLHRSDLARSQSVGIISLFSSTTPLGIAAGLIVGAALSNQGAKWFEGVFDALAAGTFIYIAVIDIIESEFARPQDAGLKFAMVLLGIAIMAVIALWT